MKRDAQHAASVSRRSRSVSTQERVHSRPDISECLRNIFLVRLAAQIPDFFTHAVGHRAGFNDFDAHNASTKVPRNGRNRVAHQAPTPAILALYRSARSIQNASAFWVCSASAARWTYPLYTRPFITTVVHPFRFTSAA